MKVLTIIVNPGHAGGAENAALALVDALRAKNVEIDVATMSVSPEYSGGNIRVFKPRTYPFKALTKFLVGTSIPSEVDVSSYDLVHIHNVQPPRAVMQVARACLRQNIPYTITTHGFVEMATRSGKKLNPLALLLVHLLVDRPLAYSLSSARIVTSLTTFEQPYLEQYGVKRENIRVIGNGVREKLFKRDFQKRDVRLEFNLGAEPFVLFVGNLKSNKGVDVLLEAAKHLKDKKVVIVGKGIGDSYEKRIQEQVHGLGDRAVMTGRVDEDTLLSLYDECTVFVLPTRGDTLPLVILDAMAFAKPVVATQIGGIPEEVDEKSGILVKPNNPLELSEAIDTILSDVSHAKKMGQAGYEKVREYFTWPRVADRVMNVYREMLA